MKFTFKRCGSYTWAMGNKVDEDGAFFVIDGRISLEDKRIVENYGCRITDGSMIFGTNFSSIFYLFVPENVYPIMETMFEEIRNNKKEKSKYWKDCLEFRKKERKEKLDKLSRFVDPNVPIEV